MYISNVHSTYVLTFLIKEVLTEIYKSVHIEISSFNVNVFVFRHIPEFDYIFVKIVRHFDLSNFIYSTK